MVYIRITETQQCILRRSLPEGLPSAEQELVSSLSPASLSNCNNQQHFDCRTMLNDRISTVELQNTTLNECMTQNLKFYSAIFDRNAKQRQHDITENKTTDHCASVSLNSDLKLDIQQEHLKG